MSSAPVPPVRQAAGHDYRVGSPDELQIAVAGRPDLTGRRQVQANGCIDLGQHGGIRVEGLTPAEVEARIRQVAGVRRGLIQVTVADYRSQQVYLYGEVRGLQRAVAYQGPETVVDLLRRVGGITTDGAPTHVRLERNPLLQNAEPEVFHVDLQAILLKGDPRTNVTVQPYDHIHVPETKEARVGRCLHPWLRSFGKLLAPAS